MNHELAEINFVSGFKYDRCQTVFVYLFVDFVSLTCAVIFGNGFFLLRLYLTEYNLYVVVLFFFHLFLGFA